MMKKKIKTGTVENITPKTSSPVQVDPSSFAFPVGSSYEMNDKMFRVTKSYVVDNTEMREIASDGEITIQMLNSLRKDAMTAKSFILFK